MLEREKAALRQAIEAAPAEGVRKPPSALGVESTIPRRGVR